jgi:hypothetical protein
MANKRYDEFTAGTPVGSDIILFGNPGTGELKKVELQLIQPATRIFRLDQFVGQQDNVGGATTTMFDAVIPANAFTDDGDMVQFFMVGEIAVNEARTINFLLNGSSILTDTATATAGRYEITIRIMRSSSSGARTYTSIIKQFAFGSFSQGSTNVTNWTSARTIVVTCAAATNASMKIYMAYCDLYKIAV